MSSVDAFFLPSTRDTLRRGISQTLGAAYDNVTLVLVTDARQEKRTTIYEAPRRMQNGATVGVRATIIDDDPGGLSSDLRSNVTMLEGALTASLRALGPAVFGSAYVQVTDLLVPPVVPRYYPIPPPVQELVLGLPVYAWIAIGAGGGVLLFVGILTGVLCARKRAIEAEIRKSVMEKAAQRAVEPKPGRGKFRRMNSLLGTREAVMTQVGNAATAASTGASGGSADDEEGGISVENPLHGGGATKRAAFAIETHHLSEPKLPMDPPAPIERVTFDFPISATTNPHHLAYLGDPNAREAIQAAITRAETLAGKLAETIARVDEDMVKRRANLVKGGVPADTDTSRLLDVVEKLEESLPSNGMRKAEALAIQAGQEDLVLLRLRHAKYIELAADLRRLLALIDRGNNQTAARWARAGKKAAFGLASFAPTTRVALEGSSGSGSGSSPSKGAAGLAGVTASLLAGRTAAKPMSTSGSEMQETPASPSGAVQPASQPAPNPTVGAPAPAPTAAAVATGPKSSAFAAPPPPPPPSSADGPTPSGAVAASLLEYASPRGGRGVAGRGANKRQF